MPRPLLAVLAALTLASMACAININPPIGPRIQTGPEQTLAISEATSADTEVVDVNLEMGAGSLTLAGGAEGLMEGEIRYNVPDWEPTVTNTGDTLTVSQGDADKINLGISNNNIVNNWDLQLGDTPMRLTVDAGAYQGNLELGGVPLRRLE